MRTTAPALLPLLRSQVQGDVLALVYLSPGREFKVGEIADHTGATVQSVAREVSRLVKAGFLVDRRDGTARLITAPKDSLITRPLTDLLAVTYGPLPVLEHAFRGLAGLDRAFIYGSWAARYSGDPGPVPGDVDVLLIGDPDMDEVDERARLTEGRLRREVNVRRVRAATWDSSDDPFLTTVRTRPLVPLKIVSVKNSKGTES